MDGFSGLSAVPRPHHDISDYPRASDALTKVENFNPHFICVLHIEQWIVTEA